MTALKIAREIRDYIRDRAKVEGVGFDLPLSFFEENIALGVVSLFGVTYNSKGIVADAQEPSPGYLRMWKAAKI